MLKPFKNLISTFFDYITIVLCLLPVTGQTLAQNLENVPRLTEGQVGFICNVMCLFYQNLPAVSS